MKTNQTNKQSLFTTFGTPSKVVVNGKEINRNNIDVALQIFNHFPTSIKAFSISRINGVIKLYVTTYTAKENTARYKNRYNIDVEGYCTRHACIDCEHFNHVHLAEINQNCPLLALKETALDNGYAEIGLGLLEVAKSN